MGTIFYSDTAMSLWAARLKFIHQSGRLCLMTGWHLGEGIRWQVRDCPLALFRTAGDSQIHCTHLRKGHRGKMESSGKLPLHPIAVPPLRQYVIRSATLEGRRELWALTWDENFDCVTLIRSGRFLLVNRVFVSAPRGHIGQEIIYSTR